MTVDVGEAAIETATARRIGPSIGRLWNWQGFFLSECLASASSSSSSTSVRSA
jgi:hypothetical protein